MYESWWNCTGNRGNSGRWMKKNLLRIGLERRRTVFFSGLGGYHRTPPASSCPLEHRSTWFLRARHLYYQVYTSSPRPPRSGLAVGWLYVEINRISSHGLIFTNSVLTLCDEEKQTAPPAAENSGGTGTAAVNYFLLRLYLLRGPPGSTRHLLGHFPFLKG